MDRAKDIETEIHNLRPILQKAEQNGDKELCNKTRARLDELSDEYGRIKREHTKDNTTIEPFAIDYSTQEKQMPKYNTQITQIFHTGPNGTKDVLFTGPEIDKVSTDLDFVNTPTDKLIQMCLNDEAAIRFMIEIIKTTMKSLDDLQTMLIFTKEETK